ncbi:MAG: glycoside hydrolase family 13 protein [Anaerovoracaceae bacterium]|jgi:cyclomaltodextrinase
MGEVSVVFNSEDVRYKQPVGAAAAGEGIYLDLLVSETVGARAVRLVIQFDKDNSVSRLDMPGRETTAATDEYMAYEITVTLKEKGLYWYYFEIDTDRGTLQVGKSGLDNRAVITERTKAWQQTVYEQQYDAPEWIYGGVFYHIFVDRFYHAGEYVHIDGKRTREDWGGMPDFQPQNGKILNNDFFGGNLQGIIEKLPYLEDLGVTCLYLSPIFEAYSNHKYDTANYMRIDPMFGNEDDFRELCLEAKKRGIHVILDGVFSHTGSDSIYFDKYHHYGGNGAYGNPDSPYRDWYYFHKEETYETWWGFDILPKLNKSNESYIEFICGENGVVRHWLREGADGWRLDVADELSNSFLESITAAAKAEKHDAMICGEVWEDASNKIAYDERKNYFEGDKLDSVMNYPFRNAIIEFVKSGNAWQISAIVESIMENYPQAVVHALMNILGTHDTVRVITALAGKDLGYNPSREQQAAARLEPAEWKRGLNMLKIAVVLQMTLPGVPCIYYGDEAGTEGYKDPFNRTCYPWGHENRDLLDWYRTIIGIRKSHGEYRTGGYRTVAAMNGLYAFERFSRKEDRQGSRRLVTAANCGDNETALLLDGKWVDLLTGEKMENNITVFPGEVMILQKDDREER